MTLTIDIGNSSAKAALFENGRLVEVIRDFRFGMRDYDRAIAVSTKGDMAGFEGITRLDHTTPIPVKNLYGTPSTLGYDRLAAAVGAWAMFPGKAALVVDFGTAITFDVVTAAGEFLGGNISPGVGSRFRALHDYTEALPLGKLPENPAGDLPYFPARDTKTAIESGVVTGILAETQHYIGAAREKFGEISVIFTGGDADYFAGRVKFPIFAVSNLVFYGLNAILEHNANL